MNTSEYKSNKIDTACVGGRHRFSVCADLGVKNKKDIKLNDIKRVQEICKEKCDSALVVLVDHASESKVIRKTIKTAVDWIDVDDKDHRIEGEYKKIPLGIMCSIVIVALSLLLIVAGNVMVSQASMDLWKLEDEYEMLKEYEAEIESKLALKNDLKYIEYVARTKLGMVDREHADVIYIGDDPQNRVEFYNVDNNDKIGLSTLLYSLGFME